MLGRHLIEGIELHKMKGGRWDPAKSRKVGRKPTGDTYWKLAIKCSQCNTIIDECLCFPSREAMESAKAKAKDSKWTCSVFCFFKGIEDEKYLEYWWKKYERDQKYHIDEYPPLAGKSREEQNKWLAQWFEDNDLGDDCFTMAEDLESEECPF